jgi:2-(1,2-epoxy-1,2-dihydrophenyl)acetyl-CoA isomerase
MTSSADALAGESVLFEPVDQIGFVTFNRPSRLNAINLEMARAMRQLVDGLPARDDVRVVVLRGAGSAFMAGGDIELFRGDPGQVTATVSELIDHFHAFTIGLQALPQPVIASVHGAAAGGGFSLALGTDLTIASDTATFTPAYLRLGTSPDGGGTFFLSRLVGPKRAMEMFLTGASYTAQEAERSGLVNRVVPAADLARETRDLAALLAGCASPAVARTKALFTQGELPALEAQLAAEKDSFLACIGSADFKEGVLSFLEKRAPRFGTIGT